MTSFIQSAAPYTDVEEGGEVVVSVVDDDDDDDVGAAVSNFASKTVGVVLVCEVVDVAVSAKVVVVVDVTILVVLLGGSTIPTRW